MKAVEITESGGPDVLALTDRPLPDVPQGHLLIEVKAAGVNRPDVIQRMGFYPPPPGASDLPGLEVAGTVAKSFDGAPFAEGARVMALLPGGGYAEYASVDARHCIAVPDDMSFVEAAALPETLFTVWTNVFEDGRLTAGERLLVHGATSGIGMMAGALARAFGAVPIGTAGSHEKCAAAEAAGYARCWNYKTADWAAEIAADGGADVVLDMVGGDYLEKDIGLMNPNGRHCSIAFLGGAKGTVPIQAVMQKRLIITGSTLRARDGDEKARLTAEIAHHCLPKIADGTIRQQIEIVFPLGEAAAAHKLMDEDHVGKIILQVSE